MGEAVELPLLRRIKCRPRLAGSAAAGLQLHRRGLHFRGDVAIDQAEGRVLFLVLLDVGGVEGRQLGNVVDALDVARLKAGRFPAALVEFVLPAGLHQIEELLVLKAPDFLRRPAPARPLEFVRHRVPLVERIPVDRPVIDRKRASDRGGALQHSSVSVQIQPVARQSPRMAARIKGCQVL
jgi:hypothetical protein